MCLGCLRNSGLIHGASEVSSRVEVGSSAGLLLLFAVNTNPRLLVAVHHYIPYRVSVLTGISPISATLRSYGCWG